MSKRNRPVGYIYRKSDGGVWYMRFSQVVDGKNKRTVQSTGTNDETIARGILDQMVKKLGLAPTDNEIKAARKSGVDRAALLADKMMAAAHDGDRARELEERRERDIAEALEREKEEARRLEEEKAEKEALDRAIRIDGAFDVFVKSKKRPDSSAVTLGHYRGQYAEFVRRMKAKYPKVTRMRDVTPRHAEWFIDSIESEYSANTRNKYLVFLRMFWRVMRWEEDALLKIDPWDGIRNITQRTDEVVRKEMTYEEIASIGDEIRKGEALPIERNKVRQVKGNAPGRIPDAYKWRGKDIRDELRVLFAIGIYTGLRMGDCAMLEWSSELSSVDMVKGLIRAIPRKTMRKFKREVIIPIHPTFASILNGIGGKHRGYVLPTIAEMYERDSAGLSHRVQGVLNAAGIQTTASGERGVRARTLVGFHSLRHTFSSIMLNAGVSPALVDAMLCHMKGTMTMRYFHENAEALAEAVHFLPSFHQFTADGIARETPSQTIGRVCARRLPSAAACAPMVGFEALKQSLSALSTEQRIELASMLVRSAT